MPRNNKDKSTVDFPVAKYPEKIADAAMELVAQGDRGVVVIRTDTNVIISRASSEYELVLHCNVFEAVEAVFTANEVPFELVEIFTGGKADNHMYANYALTEMSNGMRPFISVSNSYDGSTQFHLTGGMYLDKDHIVRFPKRSYSRVLRHVGSNIDLSDVALDVDKYQQALADAKDKISGLKAIPMTVRLREKLLKIVFHTKKDGKLFDELKLEDTCKGEFGDTVYALFMALSFYSTSPMADAEICSNYNKTYDMQTRISDAFFNIDNLLHPMEIAA